MKKRNLIATSGLSLMLLLGATNPALAQDDTDDDNNDDVETSEDADTEEDVDTETDADTEADVDGDNGQLEFEHAIVSGEWAELADILDVVEVARGEFEGVITELDFDDYDDGYYYDVDMASEDEEFSLQVDAVTLDTLELDREDSGGIFDDGELDEEYVAKLNGDVHSFEELVESTREYFDGIITDFDVDNDDGTVVYNVTIEDDHLEVDLDINAADLSIIEYDVDTKDNDSDEHAEQISQNIQDFDPSALEDNDMDDDDDMDDDNDDLDDDMDDDDLDDDYDDDNDVD